MTDLEKFVELYNSIGVKVEVEKDSHGAWFKLEAKSCEAITGYIGLHTTIEFDKNGKFISQGFYE